MVERREDPADRRLVLGELSDEGRQLVGELWRSGQMQSDDLLKRMTVAELRVVDQAMAIFQRALAAAGPPASAPRTQNGRSP